MITRKPIVVEPDQRYWRRRANRRVRKARWTRRLSRWLVLGAVHALVAGAMLYAGGRVLTRVVYSTEFDLQRIDVRGAQRASAEQVRQRLARYMGRNLLELNLHEVGAVARRDPWVLQASVRRVLPDGLRVSIRERRPGALAVINEMVHLVDESGYVIGLAGGTGSDDLPVLTGLDGLEGSELAAALRRGVLMIGTLRELSGPFYESISELQMLDADRVTVRSVSGGPAVLLDPSRIERNVRSYLALREDIEDRVGPLRYVDLRWRDRISVMPAINDSFGEGR